MLIMVTGKIRQRPQPSALAAVEAWLGPMVDAGFLQHGYVSEEHARLWFVVSATDIAEAIDRLSVLPLSPEELELSYHTVRGARFT